MAATVPSAAAAKCPRWPTVLVILATGISLWATWWPGGRGHALVPLALPLLRGETVESTYRSLDEAVVAASGGGQLYLRLRWPAEAEPAMDPVARTHWFRGTYTLYPRLLYLFDYPYFAGGHDELPVNAPTPSAAWLSEHGVTGMLELTWDGRSPRRQRIFPPYAESTSEAPEP